MKNNLLLITLIFILISCKNNNNQPELIVKKEINFGKIHSNQTIIKKFNLTNNSSKDLIIKSIKSSCGCTVTKLKDSIISNNETIDLEVKFKASKEKIGKIKNSIVIESNTEPIFTVLYLKGEVVE